MAACSYHNNRHAIWVCNHCQSHFCSQCIPGGTKNFSHGHAVCPRCNNALHFQQNHKKAPPFWHNKTQFLRYPFQPIPLLLMAIFGVGSTFNSLGLFSLLIGVILLGTYIHYNLNVLQSMSSGGWKAPGFFRWHNHHYEPPFLKQVIVYLFFGAICFFSSRHSTELGTSATIIITLALPASIITLAVSHSIVAAINPLVLVKLIFRIGWDYLLLWLSLNLVFSGPGLALMLIGDPINEVNNIGLFIVSWALSTLYLGLVAHAMMGYTLHARRTEIGIKTQPEGEELPADEYDIKQAIGLSHIYLHDKNIAKALSVLKGALAKYPENLQLQERLHRLLMIEGNESAIIAHAENYFKLLDNNQNLTQAINLYEDLHKRNITYRPKEIKICHKMAVLYLRQANYNNVIQLLADATSWAASYPALPALCLLLGRAQLKEGTHLCAAITTLKRVEQLAPESKAASDAAQLLQKATQTLPQQPTDAISTVKVPAIATPDTGSSSRDNRSDAAVAVQTEPVRVTKTAEISAEINTPVQKQYPATTTTTDDLYLVEKGASTSNDSPSSLELMELEACFETETEATNDDDFGSGNNTMALLAKLKPK